MSPERVHGRLARIGAFVVRKRGVVLAPLFGAGVFVARRCPDELALEVAAFALALGAWALRVWAMGYRDWVRGPGERHLMTSGPYAWIRHPRYVANFLGGLAWFVLVFDPWLAVAYSVVYMALLGVVVVREEEKLAQDYPGFAEWRARVPAFVPRPWRGAWRAPETSSTSTSTGARWDAGTVVSGLEPLKLALFLAALAAFAWARRANVV